MLIERVVIKGFRNFKELKVLFSEKNLLIGQNDIGKTNFIYALRLLLDKSIPESEIKIYESDFFAYEDTKFIEVTINFKEVSEDCVTSRIGNYIKDGCFLLKLESKRDGSSIDTKIYIGKDGDSLTSLDTRTYIKAFNMNYVSSTRDLKKIVRIQKRILLNDNIENRDGSSVKQDEKTQKDIIDKNRDLNAAISKLTYVRNSTSILTREMSKLVSDEGSVSYKFSVLNRNELDVLSRLDLVSFHGKNDMEVGGLGRANQIYFSLWKNKSVTAEGNVKTSVTFFFVEEPEAHLHPHSQRNLSEYLLKELDSQLLITSHSPHILAEFDPRNIIRFYNEKRETKAAQNGVSRKIDNKIKALAHRLNVIPAESFYSKVVLLVEGKSEELFYKAACRNLNINLDKLNISILSVEGVGFKAYYEALSILMITSVIRTDNDITKKKNSKLRAAGILRGIDIYENYYKDLAVQVKC